MREAFGGIFMIRLMLVFIVIYVAFAALSLNYAKAFKIKNSVISYIEENDVQDFCNESKLKDLGDILDGYNSSVECDPSKYKGSSSCPLELKREDELLPKRYCYHGIIIEELTDTINNTNKSVETINYKVITFASWDLNFMNRILMLTGQNPNADDVINGSWEITGMAKVVKREA